MEKRFKFITKKKNSLDIKRNKKTDNRGYFERLYCKKEFSKILKTKKIVQINRAFTKKKGTIRGLHFQIGNHHEEKIVTCLRGKIFDVIVDIRKDSKNFLKWYGKILDNKSNLTNFVPYGFAHGYQTLTDNCEILYFHTDYYHKKSSRVLSCFDKSIDIKWLLKTSLISDKDRHVKHIKNNFKGI